MSLFRFCKSLNQPSLPVVQAFFGKSTVLNGSRGSYSKSEPGKEMDGYPNLKFDEDFILNLAEDAKDFANTHGIVMRNKNDLRLNNFAPFTLFPSPFPEKLYRRAIEVETDLHELIHNGSKDHEFIENSLQSVIVHDEFTKKLYDIYLKTRTESQKQPIHLLVNRSDYMVDDISKKHKNGEIPQFDMKQIEVNPIACSFAGLGTETCRLHKHIGNSLGNEAPFNTSNLPENDPIRGVGRGLAVAWKLYGNENAIVLFIVQEGEKNRYDQRHLQYRFQEQVKQLGGTKHVTVWYKSLNEVHKQGRLDEDDKLIVNDQEVAIAYYRSGYTPNDYPSEDSWEGRLLIERSKAIKSPTISMHLMGTKKIQQVLATPGAIEKFIKDPEAVERIRSTFAGLYSLDPGPEGDKAAMMAVDNPKHFVLKPQREGGGNNFYGEDIVKMLESIKDPAVRSQYILMEKIEAATYKNLIVHIDFEKPRLLDVVNELGVFGVFISDGKNVIVNESVGYLLRTKSTEHDDGGVAAGRAVLDSVCLF